MAIAFDTNTSVTDQSDALTPFTFSWAHTCTGSDLILLVGISCADAGDTVASVTYRGTALTKSIEQVNTGANLISLWYLVAPATGSNTILVTVNNAFNNAHGMAVSLTGVDQSTPIDASGVGAQADAANIVSVGITTATDNAWVVDAVTKENATDGMVPGTGQTGRVVVAGLATDSGMSTIPQASFGAITVNWNDNGSLNTFDWAYAAVAVKPAAVSSESPSV